MVHTDTVIIGAGLTGLSLAHFLKKSNKQFLVIDNAPRTGGSIQTIQKNGFVYETGPNTGTISTPETVLLFDELGEFCVPEIANKESKKRLVLKDNIWHALPHGLKSAITTPLFSFHDKLKVLGEPFRKVGTNEHETLEQLVIRRLGKTILDYAVDPFVSGVYAGDVKQLIPKYALPKLYNLEQTYGSFIKGSIKKARLPKTELEKRVSREVFSVKGGLGELIKSIEKSVGRENIRTGIESYSVSHENNKFIISIGSEQISANNLVSTISSEHLQNHLNFIDHESWNILNDIDYAPVIEVAVGFNSWKGIDLAAFGGLIPSKEQKDILGILFMSSLFEKRAPKNGALFATFMGGMKHKELFGLKDEEIIKIVSGHFISLMGITDFKPDLLEIIRHKKAIPQYDIRSKERFATITKLESKFKGLFLRGTIIDGIGMADRIKQAKMIADRISGLA